MKRQDIDRFAPGTDARWRAEYRQTQYQKRVAGLQPDLFGGPDVEHFRPNPKTAASEAWTPDHEIERFADLSADEQARRLAADPQTPLAWSSRKPLTADEKTALIASAANWLRIGQRVRIKDSPISIDGTVERRVGREGVVWRLCSRVFADHVYVNLDLTGAECTEKIVFIELRERAGPRQAWKRNTSNANRRAGCPGPIGTARRRSSDDDGSDSTPFQPNEQEQEMTNVTSTPQRRNLSGARTRPAKNLGLDDRGDAVGADRDTYAELR